MIGVPRLPNVLNPENKSIIGKKHTTPAPNEYNFETDNPYFKRNNVSCLTKESRFFA
jgi:hypothetical protein